MQNNKDNIDLRSDDVQEIMSHVPHWMVRSGMSLMFLLIAIVIVILWLVRYPDVIQGAVTVSTSQPPIRLIAKNSGELQMLAYKDGAEVRKGDVLATIGNSFSVEARNYLDAMCTEILSQLKRDELTIQFKDETINLGSAYRAYTDLKSTILDYQNFRLNDPIQYEISMIEEQIRNYTLLRTVSNQQFATSKKELENARKKFEIDKKMYDEKIISKVQYYQAEQEFIRVENSVKNYEKTAVENSITITDLKRELNQLKQEYKSSKLEFLDRIKLGLDDIQNALDTWRTNYQITGPSGGRLTYLKTLNENEYIAAETPLFAIIADNQGYIGYIDVPKSGSGKLKVGQKVRARIDKYPYQEFGQLNGTVTDISPLANEDSYRVKFRFTNGMRSSYGKLFKYTPEMSGTADIITEDVSLLARIFNKLKQTLE